MKSLVVGTEEEEEKAAAEAIQEAPALRDSWTGGEAQTGPVPQGSRRPRPPPPAAGADLEASLLSFEKLDRASPDLWPEQLPGVAEFAASFKSPITSSPPKWMAELENDDIDMLKELGSLTTANLMEKVRGLQNLAYQLGLDESREMTRGKFLNILEKPKK